MKNHWVLMNKSEVDNKHRNKNSKLKTFNQYGPLNIGFSLMGGLWKNPEFVPLVECINV